MKDISVVVVSWNAKAFLRDCLESLRRTGGGVVREVIVVDNASSDGSPEMVAGDFPEVTLVRAGANLGFARANNLGLERASGSLLALVNSDVVLHPGCLERLSAYLREHPDTGLVGPRVVGADGRLQRTCGRLPNLWNTTCRFFCLDRLLSRWALFSGYEMRHWNHDCRAEVQMLSGCFWMARREAVEQVGGLDERFFFYAEDVDWCKRFRNAGWKIVFLPEATATHFGGGSSGNAPLRYSIEMMRANLAYWRKHYGVAGRCAYFVLSTLHHSLRLIGRLILSVFRPSAAGESRQKLHEAAVCLRWLLTGKEL